MFNDNRIRLYQYRKGFGFFEIKKAIKNCHKLIDGYKVQREQSLEYALCTAFGKALTTFEEIIILLANGYSNGAIAITRTLYENYTIAMFIYKYYHEHTDLLEKYFDAYTAYEVKYEKVYYESILFSINETECQNSNAMNLVAQVSEVIRKYEQKIEALKEKYPSARLTNDYWWAEGVIDNLSFSGIQDDLGHPLLRAYYKFACTKVHSSFYSNIYNPGIETDEIIYSATYTGFERPLAFSLMIFICFTNLFTEITGLNAKSVVAELSPIIRTFEKYFFGIG